VGVRVPPPAPSASSVCDNEFPENLFLAGSPNHPAQGFGRQGFGCAPTTIKKAFRHQARGESEKKI
jgi:hypothetical protein